ncbi:hypothetical protein D9M72_467270 [compost metagenome]
MGGVTADGGDAAVQPRQLRLCLAPVGRVFPLAGQCPACPAQPPQQCRVGLRTGDRIALAQRRQRRHAQIDANGVMRSLDRLDVVGLDHDAGEPAVSLPTDGDTLELAGEAHGLAHPYPAHDRQLDPLAIHPEGSGLVGGAEAVPDTLLLEPGIAAPLLEERPEACAKVDDSFLHGALGYVEHPRELLPLEAVQLATKCGVGGLRQRWIVTPRRVLAPPLGQRPVPRQARHAGCAGEIGPLLVGRVQRDAVRDQHGADASTARRTPSSSFWFRCEREP